MSTRFRRTVRGSDIDGNSTFLHIEAEEDAVTVHAAPSSPARFSAKKISKLRQDLLDAQAAALEGTIW